MALNGEAAHILIGERIPVIEESISNGERKDPFITKRWVLNLTIHR